MKFNRKLMKKAGVMYLTILILSMTVFLYFSAYFYAGALISGTFMFAGFYLLSNTLLYISEQKTEKNRNE